jgi:hypothetical protein
MTIDQIIREIEQLSIEERKHLVTAIIDSLTDSKPKRNRSILEFEGIGIWDGTDAQEYINELRDEWTHRP